MLRKIITLTSLIALPSMLFACKNPDNVFQLKFNNGESIDVTPIEKIGEVNVSYFKVEGKPVYTFRSHYQPSVMVVLDAESKTLDLTTDTSKVALADMKYDLCVRSELDWLADAGVVTIERVQREKIEKSLKNGGGSRIYYTKQDTLVYSSYQLMADGTFLAIDCVNGPSVITLPPKSLEIQTRIQFGNRSGYPGQNLTNTGAASVATFGINGRLLNNYRNTHQSSSQLLLHKNAGTRIVHHLLSF